MTENERLLIRLGLRALGGALKHRNSYNTNHEKYRAASEELMGVWRSAIAIGEYGAADAVDKMGDVAHNLAFEMGVPDAILLNH